MEITRFIALRLKEVKGGSFSASVIQIARFSIGIGLAIIIISLCILGGFKKSVQDKVFGFAAHMTISRFDLNNSYEDLPVTINEDFVKQTLSMPEVSHIQTYARKSGLLKSDKELTGVVFKGISKDFKKSAFLPMVTEGRFLNLPDSGYASEILISRKIANLLDVKVADTLLMVFVQQPPRFRKLMISGIYQSGIEDFDETIILGDINVIRNLNLWGSNQVGGYEVFLNKFKSLDPVANHIYDQMDSNLQLERVTDLYIQLFDWLALLDQNVVIFTSLIIFVALFNLVSSMLVMIMERTGMIGTLKALGARSSQIRKVFFQNGFHILRSGLLIGNGTGIGLCALQYFTKAFPLDPENYYISYVPVWFDWGGILLINFLVSLLTFLVLFIPTALILRISPLEAIRFD